MLLPALPLYLFLSLCPMGVYLCWDAYDARFVGVCACVFCTQISARTAIYVNSFFRSWSARVCVAVCTCAQSIKCEKWLAPIRRKSLTIDFVLCVRALVNIMAHTQTHAHTTPQVKYTLLDQRVARARAFLGTYVFDI